MRRVFNGTSRDGAGNIISSATVALYEAGGTTAATFYSSATSTTGINSTTSGTDGSFSIYVDNFDYDAEQTFKITISKTGFTTKSYDNIRMDDVVLGTYTISADKTVTTHLVVPKGVVYSVASGKTLTILGLLDAGLYQIFTGAGAVVLSSNVKESYPEWWATNTTPGTTDMTDAITAALAATSTVKLNDTTYLTTSTITVGDGKNLIGVHRNKSKIKNTSASSVLKVTYSATANRIVLKDFCIMGNGSSGQHGIEFANGTEITAAAYVKLDGLMIYGCGGNGVYGGHDGHVQQIEITGCLLHTNNLCGIDLQYTSGTNQVNAIWIHDNDDISYNKLDGIRMFGNNFIVERNAIQSNYHYGISIGVDDTPTALRYTGNAIIRGNYFEANGYDVDTNPAVIGLFPSYNHADTLNYIDVMIEGNHFSESTTSHAGGTYRSIIYAKNPVGTTPIANVYLHLTTRTNFTVIPIVYVEAETKLCAGSTLDEPKSEALPLATLNQIAVSSPLCGFYNLRFPTAPTISYSNSWVAYGATSAPGYFLDGHRVVLQGALKSGTVGKIAFYLPQYMWPTQDKNFIVITKTTFDTIGVVSITASNGAVTVVSGDNSYISLDGITYDKRL